MIRFELRRVAVAAALVTAAVSVTAAFTAPAHADHAEEEGSNVSDCTFAAEDGNAAFEAGGATVYAGPNSSSPDDGADRIAAGLCADDSAPYQGTNEAAVDPGAGYYHLVSDGGSGNNEALFDGWFGVWNCSGDSRPQVTDGPRDNWHDDPHAPCEGLPERHRNECPAEDVDASDNRASIQTAAGAFCYDVADLSCAHVWADLNDTNGDPFGAYAAAGNDHPTNEDGCGDASNEPDDGRSADPGVCVGPNNGPDSGADEPACANPGDTLDEFGVSLGSELDECRTFVSGGTPNPEHSQPGVCADDDGDGVPDPGS